MTTVTTELTQRMREAAEKATSGDWFTDTHNGVCAVDGLNQNYYVAQCNSKFIALANPANVLALLDALQAKDKQICDLENQLASGFTPEALAQEDRAESAEARVSELEEELRQCIKRLFSWQDSGIAAANRVAELEARIEQQPVAYTEECEITNMQATGLYLRGFPTNAQGRDIPLYTAPPATSPVAVKLPDDTRRMDWLVSKTVNVREPMVYGSHDLFWSQTTSDDWAEVHKTSLREQIDAAMQSEAGIKIEEGE